MEVQGQDLHQLDLGAFPLAASPQVLPVYHQDFPKVGFGEDLEEGRLELFRIQAVKEKGDGGVAWGLAQAQVGQEVRVGPGETFHAPQGVHA
ncbi:hypothetical protein, partial [Escherichia coli]|uniref:hypothetical protein n=1 Tax=Escherichia coli TaxID=562 RepID=UPI001BC8C1F7